MNEIRLTGSRGNPDKVVAVINIVLGDYEAELITAADAGGALMGKDPRRSGLAPTDSVPPKAQNTRRHRWARATHVCGELHWHRDCPKRKKPADEAKVKKKAKKRDAKPAHVASNAGEDTSPPAAAAQGPTKPDRFRRSVGAAAVGMSEMLISEEFVEGGAKTVSISAGAGLVSSIALRRPGEPSGVASSHHAPN